MSSRATWHGHFLLGWFSLRYLPVSSLAADLSTCVRGIICSLLRCIGDSAIVARKLFAQSYVRTFFNCVIKSGGTKKNVNLCVVIVGRRETRFFLIKIETSRERLETEGEQSADLSQSFMLKEDYVMCKLNLCSDNKNRMLSWTYTKARRRRANLTL